MGNSTPRRGLSSASNQDDEDIVQLDDWGFPEIMDEGDDDDGADDMEGSAEDNVEDDMEDRWDNNDDEGNQEPINDTDNATGLVISRQSQVFFRLLLRYIYTVQLLWLRGQLILK